MSMPTSKLRLMGAFAALALLALAAGCRGFFVKPTVTAIGVTPATPTITDIAPNNTKQFSVVATFNDGSTGSTPVTWGSDTPTTVASIDGNTGLATAVGLGKATITATSTNNPTISGSTTLTVVPGNVTAITLTPSSQSTTTTGSGFEIQAKDQAGNDISGSVTFTFTLNGTVENGFMPGTPNALGMPFTIGTLSPAITTFPATFNVVATLTVSGTTVTSNTVTVTLTS